jgi:hypothetical protein
VPGRRAEKLHADPEMGLDTGVTSVSDTAYEMQAIVKAHSCRFRHASALIRAPEARASGSKARAARR